MQLQSKAILVKLAISLPGNSRTDVKITSDTIASHNLGAKAGRWLKQLYPDEAIQPLTKLQGEIRSYHYEHTLPWTDEGYRILPTAHHAEYTDQLRAFRRRFESARDEFISRLPEWLDWARQAHNGTFDPTCYPDPERLSRKFDLGVEFSPVPSGGDFRCTIDQTELANMQQQVDERVNAATEACRADLWRRLAEPLKAMADKLSEPDRANGASPIFRDTLVSNLRDIASLIPALDVTSDPNLASFASAVQATLATLSPDALRASKSDRASAARQAAEILAKMSGYMPAEPAQS